MPSKPPGELIPADRQPKSRVEIAIEELIVLKAELMQLPSNPSLFHAMNGIKNAVMWLERHVDDEREFGKVDSQPR